MTETEIQRSYEYPKSDFKNWQIVKGFLSDLYFYGAPSRCPRYCDLINTETGEVWKGKIPWTKLREHITSHDKITCYSDLHDNSNNFVYLDGHTYVRIVDLLEAYRAKSNRDSRMEVIYELVRSCDIPLNIATKLLNEMFTRD